MWDGQGPSRPAEPQEKKVLNEDFILGPTTMIIEDI
jgi:hypothetical protein